MNIHIVEYFYLKKRNDEIKLFHNILDHLATWDDYV